MRNHGNRVLSLQLGAADYISKAQMMANAQRRKLKFSSLTDHTTGILNGVAKANEAV